ncbi:ABC transporter substrate-binding protein [Micromonospora sp. NBC_01638]|uniref:ABC transporter substrate-binding protein n=1 Tax=Micromonospora sp. NBC_01638 TaxID=2975982 RepID=UPI00386A2BED|nr:ABC transporter substrate-binding protein [Micromonospora sp. NBC_01638]
MILRRRARRAPLLAAVSALLIVLAGCGGGGSSAEGGANDPDAVLRYVYANAPGTLDPHVVNSGFANVPLFLIFDRLVHVNPAGEAIPGLATSWSFSADGKEVTFKLRDKVKFQDGADFDAEAVKANIEHGKTVEGSFVKADLASIDNVGVVDRLTAKFVLSKPDVGIVLKLSDRAGAMMSPKSIAAGDAGTKPVGTGMFELDGAYKVGAELKVKKFNGYWEPDAQKLAGVVMVFMSDTNAALNAIKSGGAHAGQIREAEIDPAKRAGLNVLEGYDLGFQNIILNPDNVPALRDEKVRLALNLAINRQEIVDGLLFGYGKATNQPFPEGYFAHSNNAPQYQHDPDRAKKLLAEAGYPDGFEMELTNAPGPSARISEVLADQFKKVGVRTKLNQIESSALGQQLSVDKTTQAVNVRWTGRNDPTATLALLYMPKGPQNPSNMATDRAIELFEAQKAESDPGKRAKLLAELADEFVEHPPASQIVLFQSVSAIASSKKVVGLQEWKTGKVEFRGVGITK